MVFGQAEIAALLPYLVLSGGIVLVLLVTAFARSHQRIMLVTAGTIAISLFTSGYSMVQAPRYSGALLIMDQTTIFLSCLILFSSLCITLFSHRYFEPHTVLREEFYILLMIATLGGIVVASSAHFASLFLGIELIGVPFSAMAAYLKFRERSVEAGFKYLVLGGVASAILLFGIALIYAGSGSLSFDAIRSPLIVHAARSGWIVIGLCLLLAGISFKLGLVPFHMWTPDVYEGAPVPAAAFIATVSKVAVAGVLLRIVPPGLIAGNAVLFGMVTILSIASMTLGNLLALAQNNVKRILAYSSISHYGYLLVAFLSPGPQAAAAILFYLAAYTATTLGAFGVVSVLSDRSADAEELSSYTGLAWRRPWIAIAFTISILSLLGIPLTAGFVAKFIVIVAGIEASQLALVIILIVNTAVGAFYYIRIVMTMFLRHDEAPASITGQEPGHSPILAAMVIGIQAAIVLLFGMFPQLILRLFQQLP